VAELQVSVLLTAYQHERFIARALDGVLSQRGVSFEVLVGDDASTDGTREVIGRYVRTHAELISTFFPQRNLGHGGSAIFSELVRQARGTYVAGLDGDDFWTAPDKLARQVAHMDADPDCSMCFHDVLCRYEDGSRPDRRFTGPGAVRRLGLRELLDGIQIGSCAPLFRREAISPLPDWYVELPWGDAPLYVLAATHGAIDYLPDVMGVYRIHDGGMYRGLPRLQVLKLQVSYYQRLRVPSAYAALLRTKLADTWTKLGLEHDRLGDRDAARMCLDESTAIAPFDPRRLHTRIERRRLLLWVLLKAPPALVHHSRVVDWRRRRAA
jgi:glycosyltransferase involved in cell wall biosynthesis